MISGENVAHETGVVAVNVRSDRTNGRRKDSPEAHPALHGSSTRVLNARNGQAALRQFSRRIAEPHVHINRYVELGLPRGSDLIQVVRLMIELKEFVCVAMKHLAPDARLLVGRRQHVGWNWSCKFFS